MIVSNQSSLPAQPTQDDLARSLSRFAPGKSAPVPQDTATLSAAGARRLEAQTAAETADGALAQVELQNRASALASFEAAQGATTWLKANLFPAQALPAQANLSPKSVLKVLGE